MCESISQPLNCCLRLPITRWFRHITTFHDTYVYVIYMFSILHVHAWSTHNMYCTLDVQYIHLQTPWNHHPLNTWHPDFIQQQKDTILTHIIKKKNYLLHYTISTQKEIATKTSTNYMYANLHKLGSSSCQNISIKSKELSIAFSFSFCFSFSFFLFLILFLFLLCLSFSFFFSFPSSYFSLSCSPI